MKKLSYDRPGDGVFRIEKGEEQFGFKMGKELFRSDLRSKTDMRENPGQEEGEEKSGLFSVCRSRESVCHSETRGLVASIGDLRNEEENFVWLEEFLRTE